MIVREKRIAFVHVPKAGGTAIEAFFNVFGPGRENVGLEVNRNQRNDRRSLWGGGFTHASIGRIRKLLAKEGITLEGWRIFATVRNPYARLVSFAAWFGGKWANKEVLTVEDFRTNYRRYMSRPNMRLQSRYVDGTVTIFRLEDGLDQPLQWLGESSNGLRPRMISNHRPWDVYYTPKIKRQVYNRYKKDFRSFGYDY